MRKWIAGLLALSALTPIAASAQDGRERTLDQYRKLLAEVGLRLMEPTVLRIGFAVLTARK